MSLSVNSLPSLFLSQEYGVQSVRSLNVAFLLRLLRMKPGIEKLDFERILFLIICSNLLCLVSLLASWRLCDRRRRYYRRKTGK